LPVVAHAENPARLVVSETNAAPSAAGTASTRAPQTLTVEAGQTNQSVVDQAQPRDTIPMTYGISHEHVTIDISDVKISGVPNAAGEWPVIDGDGKFADGVIASGNNFEMAFFAVKNYTSNGVLVEGTRGVNLHDMYIENTGVYGVYPVRCTDVLIEKVEAT